MTPTGLQLHVTCLLVERNPPMKTLTFPKVAFLPTKGDQQPVAFLDVLDGDGRSFGGDGGESLVVLLNVEDGGTSLRGSVDGAARARGNGVTKGHGTKVPKWNLGNPLLKVFDDPLRILLTESKGRSEMLGNGLVGGQVLNDRCTRSPGRGCDGGLDNVTSVDGDAGEIAGVVGEPLVPSYATNGR